MNEKVDKKVEKYLKRASVILYKYFDKTRYKMTNYEWFVINIEIAKIIQKEEKYKK